MIKRFQFPVLKTYWPFFAAGAVVYYGVSKAATAMSNSEEFINDPRNPRFHRGEKPL
ncbi:uncharacterized protein GVI51_H03993 [Nakaseomyces glabratus]|uniref:ATP synthase subunit J, mitochondrial n=1 Tax=Candida glabrata (strain ATCC 2001 / BCRC 20586 / JCM 3761 / NBRC 0622 / NRRL Y-65 / CBS 138) TaxID=284593 RepID=Q6FS17_CANGA|nr:uncharacterized protein CAGL0H04191g [Nakaseomyces glabratus]KAH7586165.1 ATP synthase j chain [Nakaseomyces glabratus]KAH7588324.1 ATP synthase j chain [Nakaseomyces glabratus]KAH7592137.1 ATP synthase j chain [Nakaseomyces glabratus]KAH7600782.1 ATP synthase j chain [Nakaseomyces glabratus]KAH7601401.1 ATP synthase j chain [Nakaseomyces glabratus]|eukprot:XP_446977.2 uncharacterized protein CAGL0H04191g [[Candida] glabrata]